MKQIPETVRAAVEKVEKMDADVCAPPSKSENNQDSIHRAFCGGFVGVVFGGLSVSD